MNGSRRPIDPTTVLAFAFLIAIVLLLPVYWKWIGYQPTPSRPAPAVSDTSVVASPPATADSGRVVRAVVDSAVDAGGAGFRRDSSWTEEYVTVSTPRYEARFSTRGAQLMELSLKTHQYNDPPRRGQPIALLDTAECAEGAGPRFRFARAGIDLAGAPFRVDRTVVTLDQGDTATVTFTATTAAGGMWTIAYVFHGDRYGFRTHVRIPAPWQDGIERELYYGWEGGLLPTEPDPAGDNDQFGALALMGQDLETVGKVDHEHPVTTLSGMTRWAAVRTKYFVCATIPRSFPGDGVRVEGSERPLALPDRMLRLKRFSASVRMPLRAGEPVDLAFDLYAGPIDYDVLKRYGVGLEEMVDLGWRWIIRPIALVILWLLQKLHALVPNYGIAIIIFSLLVKAVFHPLTKKQIRSMQRMQALQPKMEKLRERFKNDAQRLNQETMKLYREAGVNPVAGCLPLLPQMPIFYALFQVFRTTIELRGAHFIGWLSDLSQKDPYYILPIIMTASMFLQQKLSTKDPKQKLLIYLMPLIFGFLFKDFPAGLTLYWTMFNIFSIVEQVWLIGHPAETPALSNGEVGSGRMLKTKAGG